MNNQMREYKGFIQAGQTIELTSADSRSFLIQELIGTDGTQAACFFKVYSGGNKPANFVTLQSGFGHFIGRSFNKFEINNPNNVDIYYRIVCSEDIINDSRVYGSVKIANDFVPNSDITATKIMVPIYTQDFRTQNVNNTFAPILGAPIFVGSNNFTTLHLVNFVGSATSMQAFSVFVGDQYVDRLIIRNVDTTIVNCSVYYDGILFGRTINGVLDMRISSFIPSGVVLSSIGAGNYTITIER